jgi:hypothetical protein
MHDFGKATSFILEELKSSEKVAQYLASEMRVKFRNTGKWLCFTGSLSTIIFLKF